MRCQICNRETNNWSKNKKTGEYESICSSCRRSILDCNSLYTDFDEDLIDDDISEEDLLTLLEGDDVCHT